MAQLDFKLPDIGEGVTEGEIVRWFVAEGDSVAEDDPMVEVMTDKATVTIGAPCDGRVKRLCFDVGAVAQVGQVILILESDTASKVVSAQRSSRPPATAVGEIQDRLPGAGLFRSETETGYFREEPLAAPATRRLAKGMGIDLRRVRPSGPDGRVTPEDIHAARRQETAVDHAGLPLERREPIVGIRRKIAERMHQATTTAAHFTFVEECNVERLVELRERLAPEARRRNVPLTYLPFIIRAVTEALGRHPILNAAVDEDSQDLVYKKYYNIGVATATEAGLMVPVLHNADRLGLFELATDLERLARGAKNGSLSPGDLRNSTFTVTSLGKRSGLMATPILNYPEVGILGIHRIKERPVVRDGEIVIGRQMLLSLSLDHRIVDGHVGAAFAYDVIDALEDPQVLFDGEFE